MKGSDLLRQIEELEKRYKESRQKLRILFEITRLLSSYLHLKEVLNGIITLLTKEYKFDLCAIMLLDTNDCIKVKSCVGLKEDFLKDIEKKTLDLHTKKCLETKKIVIVNDIENKMSQKEREKLLVPETMKSFALTPIMVEEKVIGVLITASKRKNYFHVRYSDAIYIIANEIGIAIKMSQLYEEIYNSQKELEKKVKERTKQLEETHKKLLEAERHAAMGKMANRVAHELRNSLTVIGGFARRLSKRLSKDDPNKEYVDIIVKEVEKLERKVAKIIRLEPEEE
jgi:transcriptional regulator with GAF, ATPase, and Fis domain